MNYSYHNNNCHSCHCHHYHNDKLLWDVATFNIVRAAVAQTGQTSSDIKGDGAGPHGHSN